MSFIEFDWFESDNEGKQILSSIKYNDRIKRFGLLERPQLSHKYSNYEIMDYKIMLMGKSNTGKTTFIESIFETKQNLNCISDTPGIHVNNLFWPVKIKNVNWNLMFKLSIWDVGTVCSMRYDYIMPVGSTKKTLP
jgi:hypothetical protein